MTRAQLDRTVADRTGETLATVRRLGFQLQPDPTISTRTTDLRLVVDCPKCRRPVAYPGHGRDGTPALAECVDPRCDLYFAFDPTRVYVARS